MSDNRRVALAVGREEWECTPWLAGEAEVTTRGSVHVVADASLFGREELAASLRAAGTQVSASGSSAELIAAVYATFGAPALLDLNGDFAFILWDGERRTLLLGRDFVGSRTLYHRIEGGRLLIASTISGVLALSHDAPSLDLLSLAETASGMVHPSGRTCYAGVFAVPPGRLVTVSPFLEVRESACWAAPDFQSDGGGDFSAAADALRETIRTAVAERMAPGVTTVWMSGGYDSTSVFATAHGLAAASGRRVEPISVSYPVGDGGREDEIIERVLAFHGANGHWIDSAEMPLLGDVAGSAALRDEPFVAMYDGFFRRVAHGSRELGARVGFSGHGGDVLFDSSLIYMADLLGGLHLRTLVAEWRASREAMWSHMELLEETLAPLVPEAVAKRSVELLGTRKERFHRPAAWLRAPIAKQIAESGWMPLARRAGESRASAVARWSLTYPYFTKSQECAAAATRAEGIEYRMPLLDRRVLQLAASRPRWERRSGVRTKSLLRAAMKGMLPDEVLLPRRFKTGLTRDYLLRSVREEFPRHAAAMSRESVLGDLGIIDPSKLVRAVADCASDPAGWVAGNLYFTIQAEHWLRARASSPACAQSATPTKYATDESLVCPSPSR